jgi:hypothetical protein
MAGVFMGTDYNLLRSKMLAFIRQYRDGSFDMNGEMRPYFRNHGIELDDSDMRKVEQIFHEFYFEGILVPGLRPRVNINVLGGAMVFPRFHTTEYGDKVVTTTEYQPYDPDGYLARFTTEIPGIDVVIIRYLEECLGCFRRNVLLAAATMLGCATEKAVLLLVDAFGRSLSDSTERQKYEKETEPFIISRKWKALWKRLEPLSSGLPNGLGDDLGTILERVFDIIRTTRNEAGHPTGKVVEKETVHANLLLFPIFCKRVYGLIQHFVPT